MLGFSFTFKVSVARSGHRLCSDVVCAAGPSAKGQVGWSDVRTGSKDSASRLAKNRLYTQNAGTGILAEIAPNCIKYERGVTMWSDFVP